MIDWHSHILPSMDDGSRDLGESLDMLEAMRLQGVSIAVATPHFDANEESVSDFLCRRKKAYDLLHLQEGSGNVHVVCGAEVKYYPGIGRMEDLEKLAIEGTTLLLLEMPMKKWSDFTVQELMKLANMRGLKIVIAHIERYLDMQDKQLIDELIENGILVQVNSSFFERMSSRRKAMRLLGSGYIHFVGSDCHNMTTRPPNVNSTYELIRKKLGEEFTSQMIEFGHLALGH